MYRMLAAGAVGVGIAPLFTDDQPDSFTALTPDWLDICFDAMTVLSGMLILVGLYMTSENRYHATRLALSLHIERFGLSILMSVIAMNLTANTMYYGMFPATIASVWQAVFWIWSWTRLWDIRQALKGLSR